MDTKSRVSKFSYPQVKRKKMKKILSLSLLVAMFAACSNDPTDNINNTIAKQTPMTIVAEFDNTRTELTSDGKTAVWSKGDKLGVFCEYLGTNDGATAQHVDRTQQTYTLDDSSAGEVIGVFSGTSSTASYDEAASNQGEGGTYRYHAYYPISAANANVLKGKIAATLPTTQSYDATAENWKIGTYDMLVGQYLDGTKEQTEIPLSFKRVFAMMQYEITNSTSEAFRVKSVTLTAEDGMALTGSYEIAINKSGNIGEELAAAGRPVFSSAVNTLTVNVDNGAVAAGGKINIKSIFNRWEAALADSDLTLTVVTSKGTYTTSFTAKDYSTSDNWIKRIDVDALTPLTSTEVDNYVEGAMTLVNAQSDVSANNNITKGGTYCINADIVWGGTAQLRCNTDVTLIGRKTIDGVPQQKLTISIIQSKNTTGEINVTVKDLILTPMLNSYIVRFNNAAHDMINLTIDNCIIEAGTDFSVYPLNLCGGGKCVKNVVIKNCVFKGWGNGLVNAADNGCDNIESILFENNTIYTGNEILVGNFKNGNGEDVDLTMFKLGGCPDMTFQHNTIHNFAKSPLVTVASGALVWKDNIVSTSTTPSFIFSSLTGVTASGNAYHNFTEVEGGANQTIENLFEDTANGDFTVTGDVPSGCGDQRWW